MNELAHYVGGYLKISPPAASTISSILHNELRMRYVACNVRTQIPNTEAMRMADLRFVRMLLKLLAFEDAFDVVFVDEFGLAKKPKHLMAWRSGSERNTAAALGGVHKVLNCLIAVDMEKAIAVQALKQHTVNTGIFAAFLKQVIEQRLRANAADGKRARLVIIMDNLALHKTKEV